MLSAPLLLPARFALQEQLAAGMLFRPCRLHGLVRMSSCLRFWNQWACRVARPRKNFWRGGWMPDTQLASAVGNSWCRRHWGFARQLLKWVTDCRTLRAEGTAGITCLDR